MSSLSQLVQSKFEAAKESKDLIAFDTTQTVKDSRGVKFHITLAPTLAKKTGASETSKEQAKKTNPFVNPNPALVVKELDEHFLLLNKFAVIPNHLLLVTKEERSQKEPLFPNDLYEMFNVFKAFGPYQPLLGFYNCGENSGASQAHKHAQIIPLSTDGSIQPPIKKVFDAIHDRHVGQIYALDQLPFVHVIMQLDANSIGSGKEATIDYLSQMFFGLMDAMFQQLRENTEQLATSYNFLMTQEFMMLIPRQKENATVHWKDQVYEFSLNSLPFAGFFLSKNKEEQEVLEAQDDLMALLLQVGVPWSSKAHMLDVERQLASEASLA
ncbi:ATP adenylyltransferase-domain-containing protein [Sporodiniella umbellata]|nr:ATP adenylyltransferase-domain-containing protein [Sporodiniella umbellata]